MKVLSLTHRPELRRRLENALGPAHFVLDVLDTAEGLIDHALGWGYSGVLIDVETLGFRGTADDLLHAAAEAGHVFEIISKPVHPTLLLNAVANSLSDAPDRAPDSVAGDELACLTF